MIKYRILRSISIVLISLFVFINPCAFSQMTEAEKKSLSNQSTTMLEKQVAMEELKNDPLSYDSHIRSLCLLLGSYANDKQTVKAEATYKKILALLDKYNLPDDRATANLMIDLGQACFDWHKYDRAETAYKKGMAMVQKYEGDKNDKDLQSTFLTKLGETYLEEGKLDEAQHYLQSAYDDNRSIDSQSRLAETYRRKKNYAESERLFKEVLARLPEYPYALDNYARLLHDMGRNSEAQSLENRANAQRNSPTSKYFEQLLYKMTQDLTTSPSYKKLQEQDKQLTLKPWWKEYQLAISSDNGNDYKALTQHSQQCLVIMDKCGDLNSYNRNCAVEWMFGVAETARKKKQYQIAFDMYTILMNYGPVARRGYEPSLPTLASICLNSKQFAKAESYYRNIETIKGPRNSDPRVRSRLALCLECQNKLSEAEKIYQEYLRQAIAMEARDSYCGTLDPVSIGLLNYCAFLEKYKRNREAEMVLKHERRFLVGKDMAPINERAARENPRLRKEADQFEQNATYLNNIGAFTESDREMQLANIIHSLVTE